MTEKERMQDEVTVATRRLIAAEVGADEPKVILIYTREKKQYRLDVPPGPDTGYFMNPDGPGDDNKFHWRGQSVRLSPQDWRLLSYIWIEQLAEVEAVVEAVWPTDATPADATVRGCIHRVNAALLRVGCTREVTTKGGWVRLG